MKENLTRPFSPELVPSAGIINVLRGTVSEPLLTVSHKPGHEGEMVAVRVAQEGPCNFGLTDWEDVKEWSGIMNHVFLSTRYALYFAQEMQKKEHDVNTQLVLDGMLVSHAGRRQWDEAGWYPEIVSDVQEKRRVTNEQLGLQLIENKVPREVFELVAALGHGIENSSIPTSVYDSLEYKLSVYADHRTSQRFEPLHRRMGDFLLGNFFDKGKITPPLKQQVYEITKETIAREKLNSVYHITSPYTASDADKLFENLGAKETSSRLTREKLIGLILQDAQTEVLLDSEGINPDDVNDTTVPMPKWETTLRHAYVESAERDFTMRTFQIINTSYYSAQRKNEELKLLLPPNLWVAKYAQVIYQYAYALGESFRW